jgi:hypothetical protein
LRTQLSTACRDNGSVLYQRVPRMLEGLGVPAVKDTTLARQGAKILILDDWGLTPLSAEQRSDLLEIIDDRLLARRDDMFPLSFRLATCAAARRAPHFFLLPGPITNPRHAHVVFVASIGVPAYLKT